MPRSDGVRLTAIRANRHINRAKNLNHHNNKDSERSLTVVNFNRPDDVTVTLSVSIANYPAWLKDNKDMELRRHLEKMFRPLAEAEARAWLHRAEALGMDED